MKKWRKRISVAVLCMAVVLMMVPMYAFAAGPVDTDRECSLKVVFTPESIAASGVEFTAYRVASVDVGCGFTVEDAFKDQSITKLIPDASVEDFDTIASTLSEAVASGAEIAPADTAVTNSTGTASFTKLETGLYLIVGETYHGGEYLYTPESYLVSLPERGEGDEYSYDATSVVKWEKRMDCEPIDISTVVTWSDIKTNLHKNDSVIVKLYKDGKLFDTVTLSADNDWGYEWPEMYGNAKWSLKAQDVDGYTYSITHSGDCFVVNYTLIPATDDGDSDDGSKNADGEKLPQTGLLWWPVFVLLAGGMLLTLIGLLRRRGSSNEAE